jgi:hypothetical protein
MTDSPNRQGVLPEDDWMQLWQGHMDAGPDPELQARLLLTQVWRFDHKVFWRNFREYAVGLVLLVIFAGQVILGPDRRTGAVGFACVAFVLLYLWWKHRRLGPLDPTADIATYRAALLERYDAQIRLLRTMPYWYLMPLFVPMLSVAASAWHRSPGAVWAVLAVTAAAYLFIAWLNVRVGVGVLLSARTKIESMFPQE